MTEPGEDSSVLRRTASPVRFLVPVILLAASAGFWLLPSQKDFAVARRYTYFQLVLALGATMTATSVTVVHCLPERHQKRAAFRIVTASGAVLLPVLLCETGAWLWPLKSSRDNPWYLTGGHALVPADDLPFTRPPHLHWEGLSRGDLAMRPGDVDPFAQRIAFQTDFEGFRNSHDITHADIVFIGDSFTEAGNVPEEDSFVQVVGQLQHTTVRNLGRAGYAPPHELIVLNGCGLANDPRTVVWQLCEYNDLYESAKFAQWIQSREFPVNRPSPSEAWRQRSPTYRLFESMLPASPWPFGGSFRGVNGQVFPVRFPEAGPGRHQAPDGHSGWTVMAEALTEGARTLKQRDIKLIVLLIPMKLRVLAEFVEFDPFRLPLPDGREIVLDELPEGWDLPDDQTMTFYVSRLCDDLSVPFIDPLPDLKQMASDGSLPYLPMDTHLSVQGHRTIAELVDRAIRTTIDHDPEYVR